MDTEQRALELLGKNFAQHVVASAVGVSESRISQLLANEVFAAKVAELKLKNLTVSTELDEKYDRIEGKLLDKVEKMLPLMQRSSEVMNALAKVNAAKRRGSQVSADQLPNSGTVVQVTLPRIIIQNYISTIANQIVEVQDENGNASSLVTISSGSLPRLAEARRAAANSLALEAEAQDARNFHDRATDSEALHEDKFARSSGRGESRASSAKTASNAFVTVGDL